MWSWVSRISIGYIMFVIGFSVIGSFGFASSLTEFLFAPLIGLLAFPIWGFLELTVLENTKSGNVFFEIMKINSWLIWPVLLLWVVSMQRR